MHLFIQILLLILAYLLGSIPWGFVFGKMKGIDIREHGSKNIGATNTGRVLGKKYAIITYICDM
ncbi:MAG: glycerol-3-phosphate acyltransferase, partial [Bacilli bacterium]